MSNVKRTMTRPTNTTTCKVWLKSKCVYKLWISRLILVIKPGINYSALWSTNLRRLRPYLKCSLRVCSGEYPHNQGISTCIYIFVWHQGHTLISDQMLLEMNRVQVIFGNTQGPLWHIALVPVICWPPARPLTTWTSPDPHILCFIYTTDLISTVYI